MHSLKYATNIEYLKGCLFETEGKIYDACVQRVLVYGSETWAIKAEDLARLRRAERMMVRRMCGVSLTHIEPRGG